MTEINIHENDLVWAKVKPDAIIPTKDNENAGYDLYACTDEDYIVILPHDSKLIPTGIACAMSDKYYMQIEERGSTGTKGMKKSAGVIDSGFRNMIWVCISNVNKYPIVISKLTLDELVDKYGEEDCDKDVYVPLDLNKDRTDVENRLYLSFYGKSNVIFYPYTKAIAQGIIHVVPKMDTYELSYDDLLKIPSKRGTGELGSTGK